MAKQRYSRLEPLSPEESADLCIKLCAFFHPLNSKAYREKLGLPNADSITAFSISDFLKWSKTDTEDPHAKMQLTVGLCLKLEQAGVLTKAGSKNKAPGLSECYYFIYELTNLEEKGRLWLGRVLGADFIGTEIKKILSLIIVTTAKGDENVGTGMLILPGIILTCAHVLENNQIKLVEINGEEVKVKDYKFDIKSDVGVIFIDKKHAPALADVSFRKARILENIVIAGYPPVPRGLSPVLTLHKGEICGHVPSTLNNYALELFSAIARPGNSGGPVVGMDGRIIGMVSQSLEREREESDAYTPLPFFSALPVDILKQHFFDLTGQALPWEDYK